MNEPTATDFVLLQKLKEVYTPMQRGIVTMHEVATIKDILEFHNRTPLQIQNLRNMVVMAYEVELLDFDRMSAITHVIDSVIMSTMS